MAEIDELCCLKGEPQKEQNARASGATPPEALIKISLIFEFYASLSKRIVRRQKSSFPTASESSSVVLQFISFIRNEFAPLIPFM